MAENDSALAWQSTILQLCENWEEALLKQSARDKFQRISNESIGH